MNWLGAFSIGLIVTGALGAFVSSRNRRSEAEPNRNVPPQSRAELSWHAVHVRDDIGFLCAAVCVTNGLLAALLAVLLSR